MKFLIGVSISSSTSTISRLIRKYVLGSVYSKPMPITQLIHKRAHIGVDRSAWLNFIIIPEAPNRALVDRIYLHPLHDSIESPEN